MKLRPSLVALALVSLAPAALAAEATANSPVSSAVTNQTESRLRWNLKTLVEDYEPDADQSWRHNHVRYAYWCGQWKVFNEQLPKMGWTNYSYFGGKDAFDRMARTAKVNSSNAE